MSELQQPDRHVRGQEREEKVTLVVPYLSDLMIGCDSAWGSNNIIHCMAVRSEARLWVAEQFGYKLPIPNLILAGNWHFLLEFRSERDAVLFKTFWC